MYASISAPTFTAFATALCLTLSATAVQAEDKKAHDSSHGTTLEAHEHGHVRLEMATDGNALSINLEAPGVNIVGFEHEAETQAQKDAVKKAIEQLSDTTAIFSIPAAAGCSVAQADAELHAHGEHTEFEGEYRFTCTDMAKLSPIKTMLFNLYPSIEEIEVAYATKAGQGSAELTAADPTISLPTAR